MADQTIPTLIASIRQVPPRLIVRAALALAAAAAVVALFSNASSSLTPFVIGLVLSYLLLPVVNRLARFVPRPAAILIVYLVAAGVIAGVIAFVVPTLITQVQRLVNAIPSVDALQTLSKNLLAEYRARVPDSVEVEVDRVMGNALSTVQANISQYAQTAVSFVLNQLLQVVGLISFVVGLLIVPIWLFYVLNDQRKVGVFLNRLLNFHVRADFWNAWRIIDRSLSAYIRGQLTLGLVIGVAIGAGLAILDLVPGIEIDYILLLAIWAGVCELIPMIGALLGLIPGVLIAFTIGGPFSGVVVLAYYIVVQQIENNLLVPRITGESVGVHPALLTVMLIVMASNFGVLGAVIAAPATAIARDLYLYTYRRLSALSAHEAMESVSAEKPKKARASAPSPG